MAQNEKVYNNRHREYPLPKTCNARVIRAEKLDSAVWNALIKAITDEMMKEKINKLTQDRKQKL